ncbi:alpha/beta hydrolase [Agromyces larvae]|uniref:Alpha/beta hydrolase n=1 Tax=Agromyces larvae TaxID=2929802 RepID=A0ABY4BU64_9MICO|nr:alpha/beta hydrolase [Agromyces larvae]UOE42742.1 alpha/beta hydrolase [Agromyces larvae]
MSAGERRGVRLALGIGAGVVTVLVLAVVVFAAWAHTVRTGDRSAVIAAWRDEAVAIAPLGDGPFDGARNGFVITPADASGDGLVFLPGARVEPAAYLWKLSGVAAETGLTIVVPRPAWNLAFFDTRPVSAFTALVPGIDRWYVGGHSLGGVRACQLAGGADAPDAGVVGVILFGSYCANDLSQTDLFAVAFAGEFDGLSTPDEIVAASGNLPESSAVFVLPGLNHASFGDYGAQSGDGEATVDSDTARREIAEAVAQVIGVPASLET